MGFFIIFIAVLFGGWLLSAYLSNCNPWPIWVYQYILKRDIALVKDKWEYVPYKVVIREDPFDGYKYGYRYHFTNVGIVRLMENGEAEYCGKAKWKKL